MTKTFKLYACCIATEGHTRVAIVDTQRFNLHFIPKDLFHILQNNSNKSYDQIIAQYPGQEEIIHEYFDFLTQKNLGFWTDEPDTFPKIDMQWHSPSRITNAILDFDHETKYDLKNVIAQLEELGCNAVQLRYYSKIDLKSIEEKIQLFDNSRISSIEIIMPYDSDLNQESLMELSNQYIRIKSITLSGSDQDAILQRNSDNMGCVYLIKQTITDCTNCGSIDKFKFCFNLKFISESQYYNNCLNRKISIDKNGHIKNCPSFETSFGNINQNRLSSIIKNEEFLKMWNITKDKVNKCKDCEFRYICLDCRAYIENNKFNLSAPKKCNYDPYSGKWN